MKSPIQQTEHFVNYHLNIGIEKIIIFFDDPNDPAILRLAHYPQVTSISCDAKYWEKHKDSKNYSHVERQLINANIGLEIAKKENCHWIIHIDSDELLYPTDTLNNILSEFGGDELRFTVNEALPEQIHYDNIFTPTLFRTPPNRIQNIIGKLLCKNAFFEDEYFRGHLNSKAAIRISDNIAKLGIHHAEYKNEDLVTVTVTDKITLLHFDCIGVEDWKVKWSGKANVSSPEKLNRLRKGRMKQLEYFQKAEKDNEESLINAYTKLHFIPSHEKLILKSLGILRSIAIDRSLFEMQIND